ncbi:hypothetical protein M9Y10_021861 [Tritrichomonas musculus]|uniref:Myb-like DNA-binding domain containing protein n=1 Tax=Tritrichomonas musculus TaxID=1915356 RepID=A0ABR2KQL0_9EUKA
MSGVLHKFQSRRKFTTEEDQIIRAFVAQYGESCWDFIAPNIPGRTPRQCRNRYRNNLKPNFTSAQWTIEEDICLRNKYNELGPRWTLISQYFHGRSPSSIKNRWNYYVSKQDFPNCVLPNDFSYSQKLNSLNPEEEDVDKAYSPSSSSSSPSEVRNNTPIDIEIENRKVLQQRVTPSSNMMGLRPPMFNDSDIKTLQNDLPPILSDKEIAEIESLFDDVDLITSI